MTFSYMDTHNNQEENENIKAEVDQIKCIVQKIFQVVVDMRYKVSY